MISDSQMTVAELLALPPTVDIPTAGRALGMSRTKAYQMFQSGDWPIEDVPVRRLGKRLRVPTAPLLRYLGIDRSLQLADTPTSTSTGTSSNAPAMRRSIDPSRIYRIRSTGERITGAEYLRRKAAS